MALILSVLLLLGCQCTNDVFPTTVPVPTLSIPFFQLIQKPENESQRSTLINEIKLTTDPPTRSRMAIFVLSRAPMIIFKIMTHNVDISCHLMLNNDQPVHSTIKLYSSQLVINNKSW